MNGRFHGGALDGRTFTWPDGIPPPRGLDVEHEEKVLRYGFERSAPDGPVYTFVSERGAMGRDAIVVDLKTALKAAALRFYPKL
jgi:hypothetical protein